MDIEQFVSARIDNSTVTVNGITFRYHAEKSNRNGRIVSQARFEIEPYTKNKCILSGSFPAILPNDRIVHYIYQEIGEA